MTTPAHAGSHASTSKDDTTQDCSRLSLRSVPSELLSLTSLTALDLSHNRLESLPTTISTLRHLERLDVRHNALISLPVGLGEAQPRLQLFATHNPPLVLRLAPQAKSGHYRDSKFPATTASLFRDGATPWKGHPPIADGAVRWLRPHEICKAAMADEPQLFVDASESSDVVQGALGDCWLLSAIAVVAAHPQLLQHVFAYAAVEGGRPGSFTAQLWVHGRWERVTVDDRLPCDANGALLSEP